jgi:hypothetical protein
MSGCSGQIPNDEFAFEKALSSQFRRQYIIGISNRLIDPKGFNLKEVPGRLYKVFGPAFTAEERQLCGLLDPDLEAIYPHMACVRQEAYDVIGEEYLFIRGYRVGHTLESETIVVVIEAQVSGGCHVIDENGHIGGDGQGRWYVVLCPPNAESELAADLKKEEARRRALLPKALFRVMDEDGDDVDTSEIS